MRWLREHGFSSGTGSELNHGARGESERQDPAQLVSLLQFNHDIGDRDGPAADAEALNAFFVGENCLRDRPPVADLAQQEMELADSAAAAPAADPVAKAGPAQGREEGFVRPGEHPFPVGEDRDLGGLVFVPGSGSGVAHWQRTPTEPSPSNSAVAMLPAFSGTEAVKAPESTMLPASKCSPRAVRVFASQARAAAGCPMTAPPAAVYEPPFQRNRQPRTWRSTSSRGLRPCAPRITLAAPALSAIESGSRKRSQ